MYLHFPLEQIKFVTFETEVPLPSKASLFFIVSVLSTTDLVAFLVSSVSFTVIYLWNTFKEFLLALTQKGQEILSFHLWRAEGNQDPFQITKRSRVSGHTVGEKSTPPAAAVVPHFFLYVYYCSGQGIVEK